MKGKIFCIIFTHYHFMLQVNLVTILSSSVIIDRKGYSRGKSFPGEKYQRERTSPQIIGVDSEVKKLPGDQNIPDIQDQ